MATKPDITTCIAAYLGIKHPDGVYDDVSGNGNDGTFRGGASPYSPATWEYDQGTLDRRYVDLPGDEGNGFPGSGVGDVPRIEIPDPGAWASGVSIACWVYPQENKSMAILTTKAGSISPSGITARLGAGSSGPAPSLLMGDGAPVEVQTSTQELTLNQWAHLVFIYDPAVGGAIYIDGTEASGYSSTIASGNSDDRSTSLNLGSGLVGMLGLSLTGFNSATADFNGWIADLILKNGVFTADEAAWMSNSSNNWIGDAGEIIRGRPSTLLARPSRMDLKTKARAATLLAKASTT